MPSRTPAKLTSILTLAAFLFSLPGAPSANGQTEPVMEGEPQPAAEVPAGEALIKTQPDELVLGAEVPDEFQRDTGLALDETELVEVVAESGTNEESLTALAPGREVEVAENVHSAFMNVRQINDVIEVSNPGTAREDGTIDFPYVEESFFTEFGASTTRYNINAFRYTYTGNAGAQGNRQFRVDALHFARPNENPQVFPIGHITILPNNIIRFQPQMPPIPPIGLTSRSLRMPDGAAANRIDTIAFPNGAVGPLVQFGTTRPVSLDEPVDESFVSLDQEEVLEEEKVLHQPRELIEEKVLPMPRELIEDPLLKDSDGGITKEDLDILNEVLKSLKKLDKEDLKRLDEDIEALKKESDSIPPKTDDELRREFDDLFKRDIPPLYDLNGDSIIKDAPQLLPQPREEAGSNEVTDLLKASSTLGLRLRLLQADADMLPDDKLHAINELVLKDLSVILDRHKASPLIGLFDLLALKAVREGMKIVVEASASSEPERKIKDETLRQYNTLSAALLRLLESSPGAVD